LSDNFFFLTFTSGILLHLFYFRLGEHHLNPQRPIHLYAGLYILLFSLCYQLYNKPLCEAVIDASLVELVHILGLFSSLISYRLLWHPLRAFPGPWGAKLSAFWFWENLYRQPQFKLLQDLHSKYGPFVRTGPSDVSIIDSKAVEIIYGSESLCTKNSFYDQVAPLKSLQAHRNKQDHAQHRRQWSPAFGDKAVRGYNDRIIVYRDRLIKQFSFMDNEAVDIGIWFNYFTYDVVGDLALGRSFELLDSTKNHWIVDVLEQSLTPTEFYLPVWCFRLVIPWLKKSGFGAFMTFCSDQLKSRLEVRIFERYK
jgi:tryprostatin B 6-hydroxylase